MIYKGKNFESEVKQLKELKSKAVKNPDKWETEYITFRNSLSKKYKVTIRTIQNWLKAKTPWLRDLRSDQGRERVKLTPRVKTMLHDAVSSGKNKKETLKLIRKSTGKKISGYKAKKILSSQAEADKAKNKEPVFGDELRNFLTDHFKLDLIPEAKGIKMRFNKISYILTKEDASDVIMILSNAFNRYQYANEKKLKLDRTYLRRVRTWHLLEQLLDVATQRLDQKIFNTITLAMQRLEIDPSKFSSPDFLTLEKCCKELKPDITFDEIYYMLEKYTAGK